MARAIESFRTIRSATDFADPVHSRRPTFKRIALQVGGIVHIHTQIVADSNPSYSRLSFKHAMPTIKAGGRVFSLTRMTNLPLTGNTMAQEAEHICQALSKAICLKIMTRP